MIYPRMEETNLTEILPLLTVPWPTETNQALKMLWMMRSGEKRLNRMISRQIADNLVLTPAQLSALATAASAMYGVKWKRDWAVNDLDYNPIWNVDGTETETTTRTPELTRESNRTPNLAKTDERTVDLTHDTTRTPSLTETQTRTPNLTQSTEYGKTDTTSYTDRHDITTTTPEQTKKTFDNDGYTETETETVPGYTDAHNITSRVRDTSIYGFNGSAPQPSEKVSETEQSSDVRTAGAEGNKTLKVTGSKSESTTVIADGSQDLQMTGSESVAQTGSDTITQTGNEKTTTQTTGSDTSITLDTGTDKTVQTETGTDKTIQTETGTDKTVVERTRGGNIGVTMTQQLLAAERESNAWLFFQHVLEDLDALFTIPVYF